MRIPLPSQYIKDFDINLESYLNEHEAFIPEEYIKNQIEIFNRELDILLNQNLTQEGLSIRIMQVKKASEDNQVDLMEQTIGYYKEVNKNAASCKRIIEFLTDKSNQLLQSKVVSNQPPRNKANLNWKGSQTDLMELAKALIDSGAAVGKQKDLVKELSLLFGVNIKTPDKLIQDIKNRNNGSETLFLDKLKQAILALTQK